MTPAERAKATATFAAMAAPDAPFVVFGENALAVRLFMALATQWRISSLSTMSAARLVQTGLDYGVIRETAALTGLREIGPSDFRRLQVMEAEALAAWREERAAQR